MSKAELDVLADRMYKQARIWYPHLTRDDVDDLVAEALYRFFRWPKRGCSEDTTYACNIMKTAYIDDRRRLARRPVVVDVVGMHSLDGDRKIDPIEDLVPAEDEWGFVDSKIIIADAIELSARTENQMDALCCAISSPDSIPTRHRPTLVDVRKRLKQYTGLR